MAIEYLTVTLGVDDNNGKVTGTDLINGDENDNQIVTVVDGGDLNGTTFEFAKWGKGQPTEPGAGPGGDDQFHFDLSGFDDNFFITVKSLDELDCFIFSNYDFTFQVGNVHTFVYTGSDGAPHFVTINAESDNGTGVVCVVCFVAGTQILTVRGELLIEDLETGDMVVCGDGVARPIRWIGGRVLDANTLKMNPELRPVRFATGAFGPGRPKRPLSLSPQHRVLVEDWRADLFFGVPEVLVPAKTLINDTTIRVDGDCSEVEYFHILLDEHHSIFANGTACETLMPAEMAQNAMTAEAREEICRIFPELVKDLSAYGDPCVPVLKAYEANVMNISHIRP